MFGGPGFGRGGRGGGPMGLRALDLTADQRTRVEELHRANRDAGAALHEELRAARQALHAETFADAPDAAKIADLVAKVGGLQNQVLAAQTKAHAAVAALLTPEQRAKIRR